MYYFIQVLLQIMTTKLEINELKSDVNLLKISNERLLLVILFLFSIFAGLTWPAGRIISKDLLPIGAALYRYTIAIPLFIILSLINKKTHNNNFFWGNNDSSRLKLHLNLGILGFLSVTLYTILFLEGLKWTSASDATLIFAMTPTLTVLLANFVIPEERVTKNKMIGLCIAFFGVVIIFIQSPNTSVDNRIYGNLLIVLSTFLIALYTVYSKPVLQKINVFDFSTWIMIYGWIFLVGLALFLTPEYFSLKFILLIKLNVGISILYLAVFIVYATIVLSFGVKRIGPSKSAIFFNLVPVFGIIWSIWILAESFSIWYIPAFTAIMLGVYQVNKP